MLQVAATCNYHHRPHPSNTLASQQYLGLGLDFSVGKFGQLTKFQQVYIGEESNEKVYGWLVMPAGWAVTWVAAGQPANRFLVVVSAGRADCSAAVRLCAVPDPPARPGLLTQCRPGRPVEQCSDGGQRQLGPARHHGRRHHGNQQGLHPREILQRTAEVLGHREEAAR